MMTELEAKGTTLNYTIVSDSDDVLTAPDWSNSYMENNLALRLAPDFDVSPSPALVQMAEESEDAIIKRTLEIGPVLFPTTLPIGSGNEAFYYNNRFFTNTSRDDIVTSSGSDQLANTEDFHIDED